MRPTFDRWAAYGQRAARPVPLAVASRRLGQGSVAMTERDLNLADEDSARWALGEPASTP